MSQEPSFATIGHADEVEAAIAEETNGSSAPILRSATKAAKAALGLNGGAVEGSSGASRPHNGSGNVAADGHTNSHAAGRADGPAAGSRSSTSAIDGNGESSGNGSSVSAGGIVQRTAAVVRRSLAALGGLLLAEAPPPAVPRQYRAANGRCCTINASICLCLVVKRRAGAASADCAAAVFVVRWRIFIESIRNL